MNEHAQSAGAEKNQRFKKVRKAIKDRDISEVSWNLLEICIDDLEVHGEIKLLGKTGLMEMVRIISVQKNEDNQQARMEKVSELKEWLRKAG
jgi:hypothetical protein